MLQALRAERVPEPTGDIVLGGRLPKVRALLRALIAWSAHTLARKMSLVFGFLFLASLGLVLLGSRIAIESYAGRIINRELAAESRVFRNIATLRYDQMHDSAQVLASDFGFRSAVATGDDATIASALANLRQRLGISHAFFVGTDGRLTGLPQAISTADSRALGDALLKGTTRGVLVLGHANYRAAAAAVKTPETIGWVIFADPLDDREMQNFAALSALRLTARIAPAASVGDDVPVTPAGMPAVERRIGHETWLIKASPLREFGAGEPQALVLEYSLTDALAEYRPMFWMLTGLGALGMAIMVAGSGMLSRRLARPIVALEAAAREISSGGHAEVTPETSDEIGRLAVSFNKMIAAIREREQQIALTQALSRAELEHTIAEVKRDNARLNREANDQRSVMMD